MITHNEDIPAAVPETAKQAGEAKPMQWDWVERSVWTERMLEALERGVKGNVWFSLIDKVCRLATLKAAWLRVRANGGSAGSDHQSIMGFERDLEANLTRLEEELRNGTYCPKDVRRVYIDKPGSKDKRPLGIPAVRDRVVQAALRMAIEPIFERDFVSGSYGFRPKRGCKDALRQVDQLLKSGCIHVVDADIKAYFDSIPHDLLMSEVRKCIADGRVLKLLEAFLKADILDEMEHWTPEGGTPQGAVISPLLANLFLHPVDIAMAEAGYRMVRYADDFVVLCVSEAEAQAALALVSKLIEERGLSLHPEKTKTVDLSQPKSEFEFLGYRFRRFTRWPRKKSLVKVKDSIRQKTGRSQGHSLEAIIKDVNSTLRGWFEYFKHADHRIFPRLDGWIRRRLRSILRERRGRGGISRGYDHMRWPNKFFDEHGLFSLKTAHASILQS
ncbi:MAG: group II intron reverse transcriptase/maturase [Syntrophobacteraceae bacterium]